MRWEGQSIDAADDAALPGLQRVAGLLRTVTAQEFPGVRFHEVAARSALNEVPASSAVPFRWTINPYRGCAHACVYCFARGTHAWLDLDTGTGSTARSSSRSTSPRCCGASSPRPRWARRARRARHQHRPVPARRGSLPADARHHRRARRFGHAVLDPHQGHPAAPRPAAPGEAAARGADRARRLARRATTRRCTPRWNRARPRREPGSSWCAPCATRASVRRPAGAGPALAHRRRGPPRRRPRPARRGRAPRGHRDPAAPAAGRTGVVHGVAGARATRPGGALPAALRARRLRPRRVPSVAAGPRPAAARAARLRGVRAREAGASRATSPSASPRAASRV